MHAYLGQHYSSSRCCGMITFNGGPYHGHQGLYDTNRYDMIQFSLTGERATHIYKPAHQDSWTFNYEGPLYWDEDQRAHYEEFREYFWWVL